MAENKQQVSIEEIAVSNMISIEALANVLVEKGIITQEEIIDEIKRLKQIGHDFREGKN